MKRSWISRRNFVYRTVGFLLTLLAGRGLAQARLAGMKLDITFEFVGGGFRYRRPYVAVWIENAQGLPVRTLAVWFEQSRKGPRWLNELRRWYHNNELNETVSGPTRMPGRYTLSWDGKDDKGNPMPQGDYYVCVELAREHGPYQLFREKVTLAQSPFQRAYNLSGEKGDLKEVSLSYDRQG
ncbi:DUF2271 domain-containing protein [Meiothermus taiwanensis]|jgi:hypothetical protein|uniref:DUF2271 domain-containing protein n=2 Tax=Meiothermus taiwanensis TaxID=172827 RepID=A0A399E2K6_9DEIN|nr:DUF2271 domain-containing protein [Meiothermus taiwanensis]AWR85287.1 periplasmic protein [Meiothermus taiwanensis WR-220]KIQ55762.1 hypothetical protein SY28_01510 [Meiothermus taiwanensis]KZK17052.1 hypothetical protein A3962_04065 [Meiothermus taiwanensis]RIH76292.1 hypothetical protein Mcate_01841 [Meiothermus taiwanensis]